MGKKVNKDTYRGQLKKDIEELRDILNEICAMYDEMENKEKTLAISQRLDALIVKYMIEMKK